MRPTEHRADQPNFGPLYSDIVSLEPVRDAHVDLLYDVAVNAGALWIRVASMGTPAPHAFVERLWTGTQALYLASESSRRRPLCVVAIYDSDFISRTAWFDYIDVDSMPQFPEDVEPKLDACALLIDRAFRLWGLRKVYVPFLDQRPVPIAELGVGRVEAHFEHDVLFEGEYVDRRILSITIDSWKAYSSERGIG